MSKLTFTSLTPSRLFDALKFCVEHNYSALVYSPPGIGKTEITHQVADHLEAKLYITHPVIEEPIDYKGIPMPKDGYAEFLPFGLLKELIDAKEKTIVFFDDLGQAHISVQGAIMQLIQERRIGSHKISPAVTFVAATNRAEDKAGVTGFIEPLKSRMSLIELVPDADDWVSWAFKNNMPDVLVGYVRFKPDILAAFKPTMDLVNSPCARSIAKVGNMLNDSIPENLKPALFSGTAGLDFATEFLAYERLYSTLPSLDLILTSPDSVPVPEDAGIKYAVCVAMATKAKDHTIGNALTYIKKFPREYQAVFVKDLITKSPALSQTREYIKFITDTKII